MKERSERIPGPLGRPERGGGVASRPMGCMAVGLLCLLLSLPFWPVPAALPGEDPKAARQMEIQLREIWESAAGRRGSQREPRAGGAGGARLLPRERCAAVVARAPSGGFAALKVDVGSGALALPPAEAGCASAWREAREDVCLAALEPAGALFLSRRAARSRMRRAACSATGL